MNYIYDTPENAIISLENAYSNKNLERVIQSKDFNTEAILILEAKSCDVTTELQNEVAELLKLSLIKNIQENGFPNFSSARREFSELNNLKKDIFFLEERIFYPDNTCHVNKVFLSKKGDIWKVAMIEE